MDQVIRIKMFEEEMGVASSQNMITHSTVQSLFLLPDDAIIRLSYMVNGKKMGCKTQTIPEPCFLLPDGWQNIQFLLESNKVPSRPASPMDNRDRRKRSRSRSVERNHLRSVEKNRSPNDRKRRSRSREQKHHSRSPLERKRSRSCERKRSRDRKRSRSRDRRRDSGSPKRQKKYVLSIDEQVS